MRGTFGSSQHTKALSGMQIHNILKARARAILCRARSLGCETAAVTDDAVQGGLAEITATDGPCGSHRNGEPPILLSADATARPVYDGMCLYGGDGRSCVAAG